MKSVPQEVNMRNFFKTISRFRGIPTRVGHAYAEYAVHAGYAHMRKNADANENLIHIIHI